MSTVNITIMNISNANIIITVDGIGEISPTAYMELEKTKNLFEEGNDFFMETVNPYFVVGLYAYYKAKGKNALAALLKKEAMKVDWTFNGNNLIIEGRKSGAPFEVLVRDIYEYPNMTQTVEHKYDSTKGWEVIRDICIPVVLNFQ